MTSDGALATNWARRTDQSALFTWFARTHAGNRERIGQRDLERIAFGLIRYRAHQRLSAYSGRGSQRCTGKAFAATINAAFAQRMTIGHLTE
jgi:hypothetical protein